MFLFNQRLCSNLNFMCTQARKYKDVDLQLVYSLKIIYLLKPSIDRYKNLIYWRCCIFFAGKHV